MTSPTPPTDYEAMSDGELDRLSAERFMGWHYTNMQCRSKPRLMGYCNETGHSSGFTDERPWQPTYPDSNQVERYLFPKLREYGACVSCFYGQKTRIKVHYDGEVLFEFFEKETNKFLVISCLKFLDVLERNKQ